RGGDGDWNGCDGNKHGWNPSVGAAGKHPERLSRACLRHARLVVWRRRGAVGGDNGGRGGGEPLTAGDLGEYGRHGACLLGASHGVRAREDERWYGRDTKIVRPRDLA